VAVVVKELTPEWLAVLVVVVDTVETPAINMGPLVYLVKVILVDGEAVVILATLAVEVGVLVQTVKTPL
jgi:hypothetical protein